MTEDKDLKTIITLQVEDQHAIAFYMDTNNPPQRRTLIRTDVRFEQRLDWTPLYDTEVETQDIILLVESYGVYEHERGHYKFTHTREPKHAYTDGHFTLDQQTGELIEMPGYIKSCDGWDYEIVSDRKERTAVRVVKVERTVCDYVEKDTYVPTEVTWERPK